MDASVAAVKAPPDASAHVDNVRVDRPLPGLPGIGLVAQIGQVKTSATSTATGSEASASVHSVKLHTPAGELSLDDAGSQVSCPRGGTPTATVTGPTNATLGGQPLDFNGPNERTFTTPLFGGVTVTVKATVAPRTATWSTAAASAVDVQLTVTADRIGLTATGVLKLASSSCEAPAPIPAAAGDDMQPGEGLNPGQAISSANGRYTFAYQTDGNLVLYGPAGALWASMSNGPAGVTIMQGDGNLVVYAAGGVAQWSSATYGNPGAHLIVRDDGNVVIYRTDGTPAWATNTGVPVAPPAAGDDMQPGEGLNPGQAISSANGQYTFAYQTDGNLVLYGPAGAMWASMSNGPAGETIMQGDGDLVVYAPGGVAQWSSATYGNPGAHLIVQDDGNVVIYRTDGTPAWATNTS